MDQPKTLQKNNLHAQHERAELHVVKIGGNVIDNQAALDSFLKNFASIRGHKILVHGGGKIATSVGNKLGIESNYIDGRRITDDSTIDLVTMVYGGLVNKKIVAALQAIGCNALGLTGADANVMPAQKRPVKAIDYGWVGDINVEEINSETWSVFLKNGFVPVLAPLTHDNQGHILNTNADTMAAVLSVCLSLHYQVKLIYCFEKDGVLEDVNNEESLIRKLDETNYRELRKGQKLFAGILPKIDNAFDAIRNGVGQVVIGNSASLPQLVNGEKGTILT